jgi:hypothetical protein
LSVFHSLISASAIVGDKLPPEPSMPRFFHVLVLALACSSAYAAEPRGRETLTTPS